MNNEKPKIDPRAIPKEDYQTACAVLASSIRLALKDPEKRAEYEAWKRRRWGVGMSEKRRKAKCRPDNNVEEVLTDTIRIDFVSIPDYVRDTLAAATLAFVRRFLQEPGGKEYLDARIAAKKTAGKEAQ